MVDETRIHIQGKDNREYYGLRHGIISRPVIGIERLRSLFHYVYQQYRYQKYYFQEALGYECVDEGMIIGTWGENIPNFIYMKTGLDDVWPIEDHYADFNEVQIFTLIELFYEYISKPTDLFYHEWDGCGWHSSKYDSEIGKMEFRKDINDIICNYGKGYVLSKNGEIFEIPPEGIESLLESEIKTDEPKEIDEKVEYAIRKFLKYSSSLEEKKESIRVLADVLEYLKKQSIRLDSKDESDLFQIFNSFSIRHHSKSQKDEYQKDYWFDWFFYISIASIQLILRKKDHS